MWGQVIRTHTQYVFGGIIPTRVGTRNSVKNNSISEWGSSPRVWGQEIWHYLGSNFCRIIPTRVGTSGFFYNFSVFVKDHPHACGDKCRLQLPIYFHLGSSPRVWGQDSITNFNIWCIRIIPTRVGTSDDNSVFASGNEDHPHACGDKRKIF